MTDNKTTIDMQWLYRQMSHDLAGIAQKVENESVDVDKQSQVLAVAVLKLTAQSYLALADTYQAKEKETNP